ncbi:MAG: magnesium transporter CorA family protein [Actinobacteria bacterium]|nr:magnesium transporter CorA family protein [Actinomycetota bacterium]
MAELEWIDLVDPDDAALEGSFPDRLHPSALDALRAPLVHDDEPRPKLVSHGSYVFGIFLVPKVVDHPDVGSDDGADTICYREVDMVLDEDAMLTVRKTPERGEPFPVDDVRAACRRGESTGMAAYRLVDAVAEGFLDLVDDLHEEIDRLEDNVEHWRNEQVRERLSHLRHDMLHIRRVLGPTRDAVRRVVDDRIELSDGELFPHDVELHFGDAYDKLLRATEGLESAQDLISGVRDYHLAKISNEQNEVMKRLTAIASMVLFPTFIVGLYGQNFRRIPELGWAQGYGFSWLLIIVTTISQLVWFRRKGWI